MEQNYLDFAITIARAAGAMIVEGFATNATVQSKADDSPVTEVDMRINDFVIERITASYPTHGLLGEEANYGSGDEEYRWVCDPLDGTKAFVLEVPNSVFMLALLKGQERLLSVVYNPFSDRLYHAVSGKGAFCNNQPLRVSDQPLKGGYVLLGTSTYPFIATVKALGGRVEPVSGGGYKYMMIASGKAIGTIKDGASFHDVTPGSLIITEAGGKVTALDGSELNYDRKISGAIMSNGVAHADLVQIANEVLLKIS
jgi:fructose-1,6-bisphosphatase/inositol monophosphatase family enzyme